MSKVVPGLVEAMPTFPAGLMMTLPVVVVSPNVKDWRAVEASFPVASRYAPPAVPAETEAVGVPEFTFRTANLALAVAEAPTSKSSVVLKGNKAPEAEFQKFC